MKCPLKPRPDHRWSQDHVDRFFSKIKFTRKCWTWKAGTSADKYGRIRIGCFTWQAHRFSHELFVEPIEKGHLLVQECKTKGCVHPYHWVPLTPKMLTLRGNGGWASKNAAKTHCNTGHELAGDNLYWDGHTHHCKKCMRNREAEFRERIRGAREAIGKQPKPPAEKLAADLVKYGKWARVAPYYGVSDVTIRNWARSYGLDSRGRGISESPAEAHG